MRITRNMSYIAIAIIIVLLVLLHFIRENDKQIEGLETVCIGETCIDENQIKKALGNLNRGNDGAIRPNVSSFKLGGSRDKAYPVIVDTLSSWNEKAIYEFVIHRANVHSDGTWEGSMLLDVEGHNTRWGHGSNYLQIKQNKYNKKQFVPENGVRENFRTAEVVVYLRGGYTYKFYGVGAVLINPNKEGTAIQLDGKKYEPIPF